MVTNYCQFPGETGNSRYTYLADLLTKEGFDVEVIASTFYHKTKKQRAFSGEDLKYLGYKTTLIYEPGYPKNVSVKRLYSNEVMAKNIMTYLKARKRPDLIYCPFPPIAIGRKVAAYAEKHKIPFVIDIQDLWPEAFRMVFNPPVLSNLLYKPFEKGADAVFRQADAILAVSQTYVDRAANVNKKNALEASVFLGTDLNHFDSLSETRDQLTESHQGVQVAYIGTLGSSYDINLVTDAVHLLKKKGLTNIHFVVMGDGPKRKVFEDHAKKLGISYEFTGMLPYDEMVKKLVQCDIAVNPIVKGAAQSVINKVGDYAAAGLPVLNTQENKEYRGYVDHLRIGLNCIPGDAEDLAENMERLSQDPQLRKEMGENNRRFAETHFNRRNTYEEMVQIMHRLLQESSEEKHVL
ncbi:Glycosyltransferase involved in cell wall bisynthesis [Salimicrobium halophilum]|uniref:Glycosyltransferase involved in cell wall bisynthesis n=2 Tax=Salimicrobium halophilum TaxID=86666 RepID=A0A1G8SBR8_9BACI|nr:Glycosyltransferase involved in cell wall bisynthesis [Salimicrobium halophilum]